VARVYLKGVTKRYDDVVAVNSVDLEIKDKEFVVLVGPSGCGKTTTLRMIAGLEEVTDGKIYIGDRVVNDVPPKDRDIAMVFQSYALYPHMSVYENMAFGLKLRKISKREITARVDEAAETLGLKNLMDRFPKQLSGGQRQRVALGRAIVRQPSVFLMDEPLSNLDAKLRVQMRAELKKLHDRLHATIVYVTHDQVEAMTLGERITVMLNGEVQQVDSPLIVYDHPSNRFVAGFIGSPPMNFIKGMISNKAGRSSFECEDFSIPLPRSIEDLVASYADRQVIFGIRPQDILEEHKNGKVVETCTIEAKVDFRELMGSETYLYLKSGSTPLIARVNALSDVKSGSPYKAILDLNKIHIFDEETQRTII
jgi:multiple sugar transport system ATP-binding protein